MLCKKEPGETSGNERETFLQIPRSVMEDRRCSRYQGRDLPCRLWFKTMVPPVVPLKVPGSTDIHPSAHKGLQNRAGGCALKVAAMLKQAPGRNYSPWRGVHSGVNFFSGPETLRGTHAGALCS